MWNAVRSLLAPRKSTPAPRRPRLESLEARDVPATLLDLSTAGATASAGGAVFQQVSPQPTGTGVIRSFVRLNAGGNTAVAQGYNTDARPLQFDENKSPNFTRGLKLGEAPIVISGGIAYREFLLDINQKSSSPLVSLDELRIYVGGGPALRGYDAATKQLAGLTAVYDLDAGGDAYVKLNARLNHGSGSGDMTLLVPDAALTAAGGDYLYLYSKFGSTISSNGGFEEWATRGSATPLGSLSGSVYVDGNANQTQDGGEAGVYNVLVTLTDASGNTVAEQWTDASGFYLFSGLTAGDYTISVTQVPQQPSGTQLVAGTPTSYTETVSWGEIGRDFDFGYTVVILPPGGGPGGPGGGNPGT